MKNKIGLIAGNGKLPIILSNILLSKKFLVYIAAYIDEASPELLHTSTKLEWMHPGQIKRLINFFKKNNVNSVIMQGGIKKRKLFKNIKIDTKGLLILAQAKTTNDDTILSSFAKSLEKNDIYIQSSIPFIPELIAAKGIWTKRKPSKTELKDIKIGINIAKKIGEMDIGQSVVIGQGTVLAVEAIDGTDSTIIRGGKLCTNKAVVVKICKPNQDKRFDIPVVGSKTIETMKYNNITALAVESKNTIVFDKNDMIKKANKHNISILCF